MRRVLPWVWTGLIGLLAVALGVTGYGTTESRVDAALGVLVLLPLLAITALGSILSVRQPGNRIAWILHGVSLILLLALWTNPIVEAGPPESPGFLEYFAAIVQNAVAPAMLYAVFLLLYLFPTGHFMTPRWKWVWAWWVGATFFFSLLFVAVFRVEVGPDFVDDPWLLLNPIGFVPTETLTAMNEVLPFLLMVVAIGGVASIVVRFRRSDLVVRAQIKWVLLAAVVSAVALPIGVSDLGWVSNVFMMITIIAIPTAVTVAITRYKLFEIDRLISRTITYVIVIALLGVLFAAGAVWLPAQFLGEQPPVVVAGSTLAVAALFNPLRQRFQKLVDKRFNRTNYEAEKVVEELNTRLQRPHTAPQIAEAWLTTVETNFEPASSAIWLRIQHEDDRT